MDGAGVEVWSREHFSGVEPLEQTMTCSKCGTQMNHHAEKIDYTVDGRDDEPFDSELGGVLKRIHTCPKCGNVQTQSAED